MNSVFDWRVWLLCGFAFPSFAAEAEVSVRAFSERPFGVAEVTLRFTSAPAPKWYADQQPRVVCGMANSDARCAMFVYVSE